VDILRVFARFLDIQFYALGSHSKETHVRFIKTIIITTLGFALPTGIAQARENEERPLVFAASSLTSVLTKHASNWSQTSGKSIPRLSFGASATMVRQIRSGAPAHIFISANPAWTQLLADAGETKSINNIAGNQLVLVKPANQILQGTFQPTEAYFRRLIGTRRLAMANPELAPLGAYTQSYLRKIGVWDKLEGNLAYAQNARQTLRLVERGGLAAFVYKSDAFNNEKVAIIFSAPAALTGQITYQAALLQHSSPSSLSFYEYLMSAEARPTWIKYGFEDFDYSASK